MANEPEPEWVLYQRRGDTPPHLYVCGMLGFLHDHDPFWVKVATGSADYIKGLFKLLEANNVRG